jgi:hypothetical protein
VKEEADAAAGAIAVAAAIVEAVAKEERRISTKKKNDKHRSKYKLKKPEVQKVKLGVSVDRASIMSVISESAKRYASNKTEIATSTKELAIELMKQRCCRYPKQEHGALQCILEPIYLLAQGSASRRVQIHELSAQDGCWLRSTIFD